MAQQSTGNQPGTGPAGPVNPPTTTTSPPRDFTAPSVYFGDPDILAIDPAFGDITQGNTTIARLWHGDVNGKPILWAEGPAWNAQGRYLLWSDIPNNRQLRWLDDDGHVSVFREPSGNSNGNTFDFSGRQISFEHLNRRVVRYEHDGAISVIADNWQGKRINSPNDGQVHADGSLWFTDPPYGQQLYEGDVDQPGGRSFVSNESGAWNARAGQPAGFPMFKRELPTQVYRLDPDGTLDAVVRDNAIPNPNGLCFSPDYKHIYVARQHLDVQQRRSQRGLQRHHLLGPEWQAARSHSPARSHRQHHVRWAETEPNFHGRQHVAIRGVRRRPGSGPQLNQCCVR